MNIARREHKIESIDKLRKEIIERHRLCGGKGFIEKFVKDKKLGFVRKVVEPCDCIAKFDFLSELILSNIPYKKLINQKIYKKMVIDEVTGETFDLRKDFVVPYVKNIRKVITKPYGFIFLGKNGTGKTFIGWKILYYVVFNGFTAHYIELASFLKLLRKNFSESCEDLIREISTVDILMIDEVGNESRKSSFSIGEFKSLIKKRMDEGKPTILVSNFTYKEFKEIYGVSIRNVVESYMKILNFREVPDVRNTKEKVDMENFYKNLQKKSKAV